MPTILLEGAFEVCIAMDGIGTSAGAMRSILIEGEEELPGVVQFLSLGLLWKEEIQHAFVFVYANQFNNTP